MNLMPNPVWISRFFTFALSMVAGLSAAYWALQWAGATPTNAPIALEAQAPVSADTLAVARALGGAGAAAGAPSDKGAPLAASRFSLVGVLAVGTTAGAALISVDGAKPKPFAVGAKVGDAWVLHSVKPRQAVLVRPASADGKASAGDAGLVLQMPPQAEVKLR